jgi:glycosyltransferase involved in cell wall biosynthesis
MKIALAHDHLFQSGGAENILHEFSQLYPQAPIFTLIYNKRQSKYFEKSQIITSYLQKLPQSHLYFKYLLPLMPNAWERFDFSEFDVVLSSSSAFVKGIITSPKTIHISYCHSPTRYLWSDSLRYLQELPLIEPAKSYVYHVLTRLRLWDQAAAARVDYFIANSNYIADRIQKYYRRPCVVIYPPVETKKFHLSQKHDNFFLIVSRLRPYKRVDMAIKAFNALRLPLYIIGSGEEMSRLRRLAKANIHFLGELSDTERNGYLARCQALIHPQEEDFGITAIEAMASGRPVIAYNQGGALESVIEGVTGTFFPEQTWESLANAVIHFRSGDFDPITIRTHAEQFDSEHFRRRIANFIDTIRTTPHEKSRD